MRTTVTLDDDVVRELRRRMRNEDKSFKQMLNEALRRGLAPERAASRKKKRFRVRPFDSPFCPGVDPARLNQLLDELDVQAFIEKERRIHSSDHS